MAFWYAVGLAVLGETCTGASTGVTTLVSVVCGAGAEPSQMIRSSKGGGAAGFSCSSCFSSCSFGLQTTSTSRLGGVGASYNSRTCSCFGVPTGGTAASLSGLGTLIEPREPAAASTEVLPSASAYCAVG